jgi:hypothetical protein
LKLHPVGDVPDAHRVVSAKDDLLSEGLHAILEVPGGEEDISPHHLVLLLLYVVLEIFLPGNFNSFLANCHFDHRVVLAQLVNIIHHFAVELFQLWCEVGAPPHVARSEGEEDLKAKNENIVMKMTKLFGPNDEIISTY